MAPESTTPEAPEPETARRVEAPPVPDWGDLGDPAVTVLPPEATSAPAPPAEDPGGWAVLEETPSAASPSAAVHPAVVPPDRWEPPADEPEPTRLADAPPYPAQPYPPAPEPEASLADAPAADAPGPSGPAPTASESPPPDPGEPALADDLDALIESLEAAPRITPDPEFDAPLPDLDGNVDDLASETLAKIYAAQHQYVEAAVVYERLAARTPEQAEALLARAAEMRRSADGA